MQLQKLNDWLTLVANMGVLIGLVFVGLEIQQNTLAHEREMAISKADAIYGQVAISDELIRISTSLDSVHGHSQTAKRLAEHYKLSHEDANRWWRYLYQVWLRNQADWEYRGRLPSDCSEAATLLQWKDNQILFDGMRDRSFDTDYVACVELTSGYQPGEK